MIWNIGLETWNKLKNKRAFMTGGTGFFGRSVLELIHSFNQQHALNFHITILTRNKQSFIEKWGELCNSSWISFVEGDVTDFEFPKEKFDFILHFATPASATLNQSHPEEMYRIIVDGTRRVLGFAIQNKIPDVLFASSGAVYGKQPLDCSHITENHPFSPIPALSASAYGNGKRDAEALGVQLAQQFHFHFKIARCFAFVGPHLDPNGTYAIGNFIRDAVQHKKIEINGDGTPLRSYLYSDDLVLWLFKILIDGKSGQPYNVGSDSSISIQQLAQKIAQLIDPTIPITTLKAPTENPPDRYVPSIELAKNELGLSVYTPLEEGLKTTIQRYSSTMRTAR